jgi:hypothetical protein
MNELNKAVKSMEGSIASLQRGIKFAQEIPLGIPIRFKYTGTVRNDKNRYALKVLEGAGIATKHNNCSFRFKWAALNTTVRVCKPWCEEHNFSRPDEPLRYDLIESWAPLTQCELPLLMTWHYKSKYLKDFFI